MAKGNDLMDELRALIQRKKVIAVVGSGVSMATCEAAPEWKSLIESGLDECQRLGASDAWCQVVTSQLAMEGETDMFLSAAESVHGKLNEDGGGSLRAWLEGAFQSLTPEKPAAIKALHRLGVPIITTNYDGLIESVTGLGSFTRNDRTEVSRFLMGQERGVFHLHGHWKQPESVVLGLRSYDAVVADIASQEAMKALTHCLLFIGCGDPGLSDPNFSRFLSWLRISDTRSGDSRRHFRLVLQGDKMKRPLGRLFPLIYGDDYGALPEFLERLAPSSEPSPRGTRSGQKRVLPKSVIYYLSCLAEDTGTMSLLGLGRTTQIELPISEAYVPLQAKMTRGLEEQRAGRFIDGKADFEQDADLNAVFQLAGEANLRGVVLLGEPGAGKTTGAKQLVWRLASGQSLPQDLSLPEDLTPVFLRFRRLRPELLKTQGGLRQFLEESTLCPDGAPDGLEAPGKDLWNGKAGSLLWVLDGLDEVSDPEARRQVSEWLRNGIKNRPNDWFLVTCRFQGYFRKGVPLGGKFLEFHVRPLNDDQIAQFVADWFRTAYRQLYPQDPKLALERSNKLMSILARPAHQTRRMRELSTNPLLLTILCIVFHEKQKLPTGREELYRHCVRVLLEDWRHELYDQEEAGGLIPFEAEAAEGVLAEIAWWMHSEPNRTEASWDDLVEQANKPLSEVATSAGLGRSGKQFLERMRDEAGILAMVSDGTCGFLHLSFQEFLAAEYAVEASLAKDLASRVEQSWWQEVALLSLRKSRSFCEAFFEHLIESGLVERNVELLGRCLDEASHPHYRAFVLELGRLVDDGDARTKGDEARILGILQLFREREEQSPEFLAALHAVLEKGSRATSGLAREILLRRGEELSEETRSEIQVLEKSGTAMVSIPAGEFTMGAKRKWLWLINSNRNQISKGFLLGKYPVTNSQYRRYMDEVEGVSIPEYFEDRRFNQGDQPLVGVSWAEARAYCEWVGGRLPTEAEWEYACRAGSQTEYCYGDDPKRLGEYAWFQENSEWQTQPVGTKKANEWGLHDMHGNVFEWCEDRFDKGSDRVIRGGSWNFDAEYCRSAFRDRNGPSSRYNDVGFRVARSSI